MWIIWSLHVFLAAAEAASAADYVSPHIYCFWRFMISLPVYLHSDKTQEQSNKSSMMKNNDNKVNKEKQMSRADCRRGEKRGRKMRIKWREREAEGE